MGKMRKVVFAVLIATLLGGFAWLVFRQREPVYQGKPLRYWLEVAILGKDGPETHQQADQAIKKIGTNALPTLVRMIQAKDSSFELKIEDWAYKLLRIDFHSKSAPELHSMAQYGFFLLGREAKPAIPQLVKLLPEHNDSGAVPAALASIGPDGVVALVAGLTNADPNVRIKAADGLGIAGDRRFQDNFTPDEMVQINLQIKKAVSILTKLLEDPSDDVRCGVADALGEIGSPKADTSIPALIATLQDPGNSSGGSDSAISAALALARFHRKAQAAVAALLWASQQSRNPALQSAAAEALKAIDPEAAAKAGVK